MLKEKLGDRRKNNIKKLCSMFIVIMRTNVVLLTKNILYVEPYFSRICEIKYVVFFDCRILNIPFINVVFID